MLEKHSVTELYPQPTKKYLGCDWDVVQFIWCSLWLTEISREKAYFHL